MAPSKQTKEEATTLYLADEFWENIVKFLINDQLSLKSLSLVSKQLLSVTNRFKFSLTICDQTLNPNNFPLLFHRFPNITTLNLTRFHGLHTDSPNLDRLLGEISVYPILQLKSLNLSNHSRSIPSKGFTALSKKLKTSLKSLICSNIASLNHTDLTYIANCFPFLEELDLSSVQKYFIHMQPYNPNPDNSITKEALPWRKLVIRGCHDFTYDGIFSLLCKCQFLQHLDLQNARFLNDQHVADLSWFLGKLVSVNFSGCDEVTDSAMFALLRNCPLLGEIRMESTGIGKYNIVKDLDSVNPHHGVKSLQLGNNSWLMDESIKFFASIFPNLELLDLSFCSGISDQGVVEVLRRCLKIRHLAVKSSPRVRLLGMNFQVPKLEVLSMSYSSIDDKTLDVISKSCSGLLELELENCDVTEIGVRLVIENCTKLRKIKLSFCHKVAVDVFAWMVNSRPSLEKILAPYHFRPSDSEAKLFSEHGCLTGYDPVFRGHVIYRRL